MFRRNIRKTTWVELSHNYHHYYDKNLPSLRVRTHGDENENAPLRLLQVGILCHNSSHMTSEHMDAVKHALTGFLSHSVIGDKTTLVTFRGDTAFAVLSDDDFGMTGFGAGWLSSGEAAINDGVTAGNTADLSEGIPVLNSITPSYDAVILIIDGTVWEHRGSSWEYRGCVWEDWGGVLGPRRDATKR
jgi:hypothetical protein